MSWSFQLSSVPIFQIWPSNTSHKRYSQQQIIFRSKNSWFSLHSKSSSDARQFLFRYHVTYYFVPTQTPCPMLLSLLGAPSAIIVQPRIDYSCHQIASLPKRDHINIPSFKTPAVLTIMSLNNFHPKNADAIFINAHNMLPPTTCLWQETIQLGAEDNTIECVSKRLTEDDNKNTAEWQSKMTVPKKIVGSGCQATQTCKQIFQIKQDQKD